MLESFFIYGALPANAESGTYQMPLLALSYLVASFAAYTALSMTQYMIEARTAAEKRLFHWGAALAMGGGVWAAHFIGLLSYKVSMAVEYDFWLTLLALLVAISTAYHGLWVIARDRLPLSQLLTSTALMGFAVFYMDYISTASIKTDADLRYMPGSFFLFMTALIGAIALALWMTFTLIQRGGRYYYPLQIGAALVIGVFILGVHYMGTSAIIFLPHANGHHDSEQSFVIMALTISIITGIILSLALTAGVYNKLRMKAQLLGSEAHLRETIRELAASRQYLQNVLDHIPDPVFIRDNRHLLIGGNKALWTLLGGAAEKFIGKDEYSLSTKAGADVFSKGSDETFDSGVAHTSEEIFIDPSGKKHILSTKKALFRDDAGAPYLVGVARDVTEIKKTEERLLKYTRDLESSNRELDDFAYVVSHDLKEPLRGIQSFSRFLLEDYEDKLDEEGKKKLRTISDLTKRLESFLDTLLHYSRLGRTEMSLREVTLDKTVRDVIDMFSINLKEKSTTVEISGKLPTIICDYARIAEVFQNLIGNAIKYNDNKENKIEIGVMTDHPRAPGKTVFYVRDHGIGIPEKHLEIIFKMFKRLHPRDAYDGGTGSGLAIAKKIISQHGGEIWAESKGLGQGTTFFFTIPQHRK